MYVARIKFSVEPLTSYEVGKVYELYSHKEIRCLYRYTKDNYFEFVLGNFDDKEKAFEEGKRLYSSLLFLLNCECVTFDLDVLDFDKENICSQGKHLSTKPIGVEPDKFYFSNHNFNNNYNGLEIFEIENDFFREYDCDEWLNKIIYVECLDTLDYKFNFDELKHIRIQYNEKSRRILELLRLVHKENDILIKILILSMAFEATASMELQEKIDKCNSSSTLNKQDKVYIEKMMASEKDLSVRKKCHLFIEMYADSKAYEKDKTVFNKFYDLRSKITHGEEISNKTDAYNIFSPAYNLFLKLFRKKFERKPQ